MVIQPTNGADAIAFFESQPKMAPGTEGYWQVWGARARHARAGDIVISKSEDNTVVDYVAETFVAKSLGRVGIIDGNGERFTIGQLAPVVLVRWGTHNTLA